MDTRLGIGLWSSVEFLRHKLEVLERHCEAVGRDPGQIELTCGLKPAIRDTPAGARGACGKPR